MFVLYRFYIQLFTEGKMRGQAFVSLPSEKAAQLAINDTNSFLLKDKPMVVVSYYLLGISF